MFRDSLWRKFSLLRSRLSGCHETLGEALRDIPKDGCEGDERKFYPYRYIGYQIFTSLRTIHHCFFKTSTFCLLLSMVSMFWARVCQSRLIFTKSTLEKVRKFGKSFRWSYWSHDYLQNSAEYHCVLPKTIAVTKFLSEIVSLNIRKYWEQRYTVVRENIPIFLEKVQSQSFIEV